MRMPPKMADITPPGGRGSEHCSIWLSCAVNKPFDPNFMGNLCGNANRRGNDYGCGWPAQGSRDGLRIHEMSGQPGKGSDRPASGRESVRERMSIRGGTIAEMWVAKLITYNTALRGIPRTEFHGFS